MNKNEGVKMINPIIFCWFNDDVNIIIKYCAYVTYLKYKAEGQ